MAKTNARKDGLVKSPLLPCGHTQAEHDARRKNKKLEAKDIKRFQKMLKDIGEGKLEGFIYLGAKVKKGEDTYFDGVVFRHEFPQMEMVEILMKHGGINPLQVLASIAEVKFEQKDHGHHN